MRSDQKELFEQWKDFEICFEIKLAVRATDNLCNREKRDCIL